MVCCSLQAIGAKVLVKIHTGTLLFFLFLENRSFLWPIRECRVLYNGVFLGEKNMFSISEFEISKVFGGWDEYCNKNGYFQIYDDSCSFKVTNTTCISVTVGNVLATDVGTMGFDSNGELCPLIIASIFPVGSKFTISCVNKWDYCTGKIYNNNK